MKVFAKPLFFGMLILLSNCVSVSKSNNLQVLPLSGEIATVASPSYDTYITASQNLITDIPSDSLNKAQKDYLSALSNIKSGAYDIAENLLSDIIANTPDTTLKVRAEELLINLLGFQSRWGDIVNHFSEEDNNLMLAQAYHSVEKEKWQFPDQKFTLPLKTSLSGTPIVEVRVNGKKYKFWIDTGASISVIKSDVAQQCGVKAIHNENIKINSATEDVHIQPAIIENLEIGDLKIKNHPVMILDKSALTLKIFKFITLVKIDGIIGENAIRQMHLRMDMKNGLITISQPKKQKTERNFIWALSPVVFLKTVEGKPVNFFFDSGANETELYSNYLTKHRIEKGFTRKSTRIGAGGKEKGEETFFKNFTLILDQKRLQFQEISCKDEQTDESDVIIFDGCLGCDIFANKIVEIDYLNGRLNLFDPSEAEGVK